MNFVYGRLKQRTYRRDFTYFFARFAGRFAGQVWAQARRADVSVKSGSM